MKKILFILLLSSQFAFSQNDYSKLTPSSSVVAKTGADGKITVTTVDDLYENGQMKSSGKHTIDNKKTGLWYYFDEKGNLTHTGNYANDEAQGIWKFYENNVIDKVQTYDKGVLSGLYQKYDNGVISMEGPYIKDVQQGVWKIYKNGKLNQMGELNKGQVNGEHTFYAEDGVTVLRTVTFVDGVANGPVKIYHANGKVKSTGAVTNGSPTGVWNDYDEAGKLTKTETK